MVTLYSASIPSMLYFIRNLKVILTKAEQHCASKGIDQKTMINYRLIEDMRPLAYQVQSTCDTIKFLVNRVGGQDLGPVEDNEETFEQLQSRIDSTIEKISKVPEDCMNGQDDRIVTVATRSMGTYKMSAQDYVFKYALPNFHFHLTSAYCLIREQGVSINAFDYLDTERKLFIKA